VATTITTPFLAPDTSLPANGSGPEFTATLTTITPEMAKEIMQRHDQAVEQKHIAGEHRDGRNRPIRWKDVAAYARDMKAGNWNGRNGETVKLARDGTVPDGQHRLYACIQAQVPFECLVVSGVDPEAQDTIDAGVKRKMSDQLNLRGEQNALIMAAVARWSWRWLRGARKSGGSVMPNPTNPELTAFIEADERLRYAASFAAASYAQFRSVRASVYGMAWMLLHGSDYLAADVFLGKIVTGADVGIGHPALAFRNRMIRARETGERLNEHEQLACLIIAWNAFKEDRQLTRINLPAGKLSTKNFPEPR
jgi:hypothetical protein